MKKRGISTVVATVLIILITVAAVAIIWAAIIPMIKEKLDFSGLSGEVSVVNSGGWTIYDAAKKIAIVQVKRDNGKSEIKKMKLIFGFSGNSDSSIVEAPKPNQAQTYAFNLSGCLPPKTVSVAPILVVGKSEKEGAISSRVKISEGTIVSVPSVFYKLKTSCSGQIVPPAGCTAANDGDCISGPIAWYKFDNGSGTTAYDGSGNNNGTIYGATFVAGKVGKALSFNGMNDWINLSTDAVGPNLEGASAVTVSAWLNSNGSDVVDNLAVSVKVASTGTGGYAGAYMSILETGIFRFGGRSQQGDSFQDCQSNFNVSAGNTGIWFYGTGILDYTNDKIYIYINGVLNKTCTVIFGASSWTQGVTGNSFDVIGGDYYNGAVQIPFNGSIDEVKIYNYARTPQQICGDAGETWDGTNCESYCGNNLTDSRDGKTYKTVLIGNQCWMAQNMNVGIMISGASDQTNNGAIEKYCYNDNESICTSDGGLYQWGEAMRYVASCNGIGPSPNDACTTPVQGICPSGWHMPSHYEWTTLERAVCTSTTCATDFPYDESTTGFRGTDEGEKLVIAADCILCDGTQGSSGFEALLVGTRYYSSGSFVDRGSDAYFWSSFAGGDAWRQFLYPSLAIDWFPVSKSAGYSVRCLKDIA